MNEPAAVLAHAAELAALDLFCEKERNLISDSARDLKLRAGIPCKGKRYTVFPQLSLLQTRDRFGEDLVIISLPAGTCLERALGGSGAFFVFNQSKPDHNDDENR